MTIQITPPEVEVLINQRLQIGALKDAEDVIPQALRPSPSNPTAEAKETHPHRSLRDIFEAVRVWRATLTSPAIRPRPVDLS